MFGKLLDACLEVKEESASGSVEEIELDRGSWKNTVADDSGTRTSAVTKMIDKAHGNMVDFVLGTITGVPWNATEVRRRQKKWRGRVHFPFGCE
ncbi:hypothetical protein [Blastopirellula retiformator]|uniref:Uncharacterized protein n=1 Tax=Blastopirellula retiformator TaxID=2527970 RepID=A0A5C5V6W0_9BACT|nr:hypothetical protein [Blastopirellula retiformator]TWT34308.1 hypothetical protein Enr8_17020 [Blastopirellula retiformator]